MTGWKVFKFRFMDDINYQRKVLGTVIDWTVWVYVFLPFAVMAMLLYIDVWQHTSTYWLEPLPPRLMISFILLVSFGGRFRSYMQEADQLFLLDRNNLYRGLRMFAFGYSMLQLSLTTVVILLVFLPWLIQLAGLSPNQLVYLSIFLLAFRVLISTIRKVLSGPVKRLLVVSVLYGVTATLLFYLSLDIRLLIGAVGLILLCVGYMKRVVQSKHYFYEEVNAENKERSRYAKFILGAASNVEKAPIRFGKRPLFLRKSRRLFQTVSPENGLLELLVKGFLRHSVYFNSYLRIVVVTMSAIVIIPVSMKWLMFLLFVLFLNYNSWLKGLYEKMLDQQFFSIIPVTESVREHVWLRFKRLLMIPAVSVAGVATIVFTILGIG